MTDALFAIGDIHGQAEALDDALGRVSRLADGAAIVFIGDYIDRGPDSRGVIDRLMDGQAEGRRWICLQGNHDTFLGAFLDGPDAEMPEDWIGPRWLSDPFGGRETLASYGVDVDPRRAIDAVRADALEAVPRAHRDWLDARPRMHKTDDHIFVHAGIRPGIALALQDPEDLIWIRHEFLDDPRDHGRLVVHGHTPGPAPMLFPNRLNLDGGAGYGRALDPVRLLGREAVLIGSGGEVRL